MKTQQMRHESAGWVVVAGLAAMLLALTTGSVGAATASWTNTAAGTYSWNVNGNWDTGTFPNNQDDVACLTNNIAGDQTVDLGGAIKLGRLRIGDADSSKRFVITNTTAGALTFQVSSGSALIEKTGITAYPVSSDVIAAPITLASPLVISNLVNMGDYNQPLTLAGNISESGGSRSVTFVTVNRQGFILSGSNSYSGGTVLSLYAYSRVEVRNPNAFGTGAVTTSSGYGSLYFNLTNAATFSQDMQLSTYQGVPTLYNMSTNPVTLNGALSGGGVDFFYLNGAAGNGGFVFGGNNTSTKPLYTLSTSVTILTNTAINSFSWVLLAEGNNNTGKVYLANGVAATRNFEHHHYGDMTVNTPVYVGMSQAGTASISGTVDLNGHSAATDTAVSDFYLDTPSGATLTISGVIKNTSTYSTNRLVKIGAGTVVLSGANTYPGMTTINNGTLSVSNNSALGKGLVTMAGGTLAASVGSWAIANTINLASNGVIDTGANSLTLLGAITNSGALTKLGAGTLALTGSNTYSGATVVNGGTVQFYSTPAVAGINYFKITGDSDSGLSSGNIYTHAINPNGGSAIVNGIPFTGATSGNLAAGDLTHKSYTYTGVGGGTVTINNSIGPSLFGTHLLSGYNGWAGIPAGGLYNVYGNCIYSQGGVRTNILNGLEPNTWYDVRLYHRPWGTSGRPFSVSFDVGNNGTVETNSPTIDEDAPQNTAELAALGIAQTNAWAMSYVFKTGASDTNIALTMPASWYNSFGISCQKVVNMAVFGGAFPVSSALTLTNGAVLDLNGNSQTLANLNGGGTVTNSAGGALATLTLNGSGTSAFSGGINGAIGLVKAGAVMQSLAGTNAFSGGTTVSNGTLLVDGSVTGVVTVVAGGTLGGTGVVAGVVTNSGAITAAGTNTIGTLTVSNLVMGAYSTYQWNYDASTADLITVNGVLTLPAVATVNVSRVSGSLPSPAVLFTFGAGAGYAATDTNLSSWVITGARGDTRAVVRNKQVLLLTSNGMIVEIY